MLVYANHFNLQPNNTEQLIKLISKWIGRRSKSYIDPARLGAGVRELRLKDGSIITSCAAVDKNGDRLRPFVFCARLTHPDDRVSGRRWISEIGLRQADGDDTVECSVLVQTNEVSARVISPIQATRPGLVKSLIDGCNPVGVVPGITIKRLQDEGDAKAFHYEIERKERDYPIILLSPKPDGTFPVNSAALQRQVIGLADIVETLPEVNTFQLEAILGRRYVAFGGAIKIIFPIRSGSHGEFSEVVLLKPSDIIDFHDREVPIESEVLSAITHRTNLPYSWKHISMDSVRQAVLRDHLSTAIRNAKENEEVSEYVELLEIADQEIQHKENDLQAARSELDLREAEVRRLESDVAGLKHALSGAGADSEGMDDIQDAPSMIRELVEVVCKNQHTLLQALQLLKSLYPDRVVVLGSALSSADASDKAGFRHAGRAWELLLKLVNEYWTALVNGKGDQHAKECFGHNTYAQNEGQALSRDGRRKRAFPYKGTEILMEKHVKYGVKDSAAETLRIHFEWIADEKKIIIGHCGRHLDF